LLGLLVGGLLRGLFAGEPLGLGLLLRDPLLLGFLGGGLPGSLFSREALGLGLRRLLVRRLLRRLFASDALGLRLRRLLVRRFLRRLFARRLVGVGLRRLLGLGLREQRRVRRQFHAQHVAVGRDVGVELALEADHDAGDGGRRRAVRGGLDRRD